jgi:hypothetical protein
MGLRMQPRNEKFFTLFSKAGSNVVERPPFSWSSSQRRTSAGRRSPNSIRFRPTVLLVGRSFRNENRDITIVGPRIRIAR